MNANVNRRTAMTLLEVLIVIVIISIVLGLFLTAVQRVRQSASQLQTVNRFHQLGLGMHSYLSANQGRMPGYYLDRTPYVTDPKGSWSCPVESFLPYVDSKSAIRIGSRSYFRSLVNPSDPSLLLPGLAFAPGDANLPDEFTSCVVNRLLFVSLKTFPECVSDGTSSTIAMTEHYTFCGTTGSREVFTFGGVSSGILINNVSSPYPYPYPLVNHRPTFADRWY